MSRFATACVLMILNEVGAAVSFAGDAPLGGAIFMCGVVMCGVSAWCWRHDSTGSPSIIPR